ncbi:hypothetical protein AVEN_123505-1 [Araneus ventricosus]|uniref:Uncharacterized protein n=1 Tax=Araneus ventricosus TaxID=182803 RepID=A0A4Y2GNZ2_ARAVE|nr:hypothetical protein AVEN_123505-1 [Araneus ventricosus]
MSRLIAHAQTSEALPRQSFAVALRLPGWIASTYQRDTEPRDSQECSQVEPRVRGMLIPRGCLPKSELLRDFQSELIGAPEPETQFETPNPFLSVLSNIQFLFTPSGSGAPPTFSYTG